MPFADRLRIVYYAIVGESLNRAFWYVVLAGGAWLVLHVILARWLARRRISDKAPTFGQMSREVLYSAPQPGGLRPGYRVHDVCVPLRLDPDLPRLRATTAGRGSSPASASRS